MPALLAWTKCLPPVGAAAGLGMGIASPITSMLYWGVL
jgi:hypothetical protein